MDYYYKYLQSRIAQKKAFPSTIEKAVICAIGNYNAHDDFDVIVVLGDECYHCACTFSPDTSRYTIRQLSCFKHALSGIYSPDGIDSETADKYDYAFHNNNGWIEFDEYYGSAYPELAKYNADINEALGQMELTAGNPVFAYGDYIDRKAVLYGLQTKIGKVQPMEEAARLHTKSRTDFSEIILKTPVNVSEESKIISYLGSNSLRVFVPDDDMTLNSSFWNESLWREVVPKDCIKCEIAGTPCYVVNISFEIDGFNNIFCKTGDGCGHDAYTLIHAPWGVPHTDQKTESSPTENENQIPVNPEANHTDDEELACNHPETIKIEIPEDAILTYTDIFTERFVRGVEDVLIRDSYICQPYQFANLRNFIKALNTVIQDNEESKKLRSITIETQRACDILKRHNDRKNQKNGDVQDVDAEYLATMQKKQDKAFEKLGKTLSKNGIKFKYSYSKFHDRKIKFSNGWTVDLGRGLDIFQKPVDDMQPVRCKDCTITFIFGNTERTARRKSRKHF